MRFAGPRARTAIATFGVASAASADRASSFSLPTPSIVSVAVGTLDRPTGLRIAGHWYSHHAGDWDDVPDDGLPRDDELARSERRWT